MNGNTSFQEWLDDMERWIADFPPLLKVLVFLWVVMALVAAAYAPRGRSVEFFLLALLFLGPLGIGFASVAVPRATVAYGLWQFTCKWCEARQNIPEDVPSMKCWRCGRIHTFEQKKGFAARSIDAIMGPHDGVT